MFNGISGSGKTEYFKHVYQQAFGKAFTMFDNPNFSKLGDMEPIVGKKLVLLDEVDIVSPQCYAKLKGMITSDTVQYRLLYNGAKEYCNFTNWILLTNNSNAIKPMSINERRFLLFSV